LVLHPGAHEDSKVGMRLIAQGLDAELEEVPGKVGVLLEVTAGQGSSVGHRFEHLAGIIDQTLHDDRVGICLDTCHLYAAGYDIKTQGGFRATMNELDSTVGISRVKAAHLNDCLNPLGCKVDRHEEIGEGHLGLAAFKPFLTDSRLADVLGILETPEPEKYRANLKKLRGLLGKTKT
jgi:deoxyribonuclease-4